MLSASSTSVRALISADAGAGLRVTATAHRLQKDGNRPEEYEDAFAVNAGNSRLALADGASDSYDSGRWARLLVDAFIDVPPPAAVDGLRTWLAEPARSWLAGLDYAALPWNQQAKARLGAHSTFLGVELELAETGAVSWGAPCGAWRAIAIGDSCLFHVRAGALLTAFPLACAAAFGGSPALVATNPAYRGASIERLATAQGELRLGDTLILATDALAQSFLRRQEQGEAPWRHLLTGGPFPAFITAQRALRRLRNDDVTLLIAHVTADGEPVPPSTTAMVPKRDSDRWFHWPC
jgi:hypothetical protein